MTLQKSIAGTYKLDYAKFELRPIQFAEEPTPGELRVYSIRVGTKNHKILFVNHTDRSCSSTTAHQLSTQATDGSQDPDIFFIKFQYSTSDYYFQVSKALFQAKKTVNVKLEKM